MNTYALNLVKWLMDKQWDFSMGEDEYDYTPEEILGEFESQTSILHSMETITSFVDAEVFSQFQRRLTGAKISKTRPEENKLQWADGFLEYVGLNIWEGNKVVMKLHLYTYKK